MSKRPLTQHEKIRKIVLGAFFVAIAIWLGISKIGFIPLPLPIAAAQFFHIPIILAGIFVGPEIGFLCGIVFGFYAFLTYGSLFPWFVLIPARPFIGLTSYYAFMYVYSVINRKVAPIENPKKMNLIEYILIFLFLSPLVAIVNHMVRKKYVNLKYLIIPSVIAGIIGSLTNSVGTLGLGYYFKVFGKTIAVNNAAIISSIPVVIIEALIAAILVPMLVVPLYNYLHQ